MNNITEKYIEMKTNYWLYFFIAALIVIAVQFICLYNMEVMTRAFIYLIILAISCSVVYFVMKKDSRLKQYDEVLDYIEKKELIRLNRKDVEKIKMGHNKFCVFDPNHYRSWVYVDNGFELIIEERYKGNAADLAKKRITDNEVLKQSEILEQEDRKKVIDQVNDIKEELE